MQCFIHVLKIPGLGNNEEAREGSLVLIMPWRKLKEKGD